MSFALVVALGQQRRKGRQGRKPYWSTFIRCGPLWMQLVSSEHLFVPIANGIEVIREAHAIQPT